jgi:hypothetical protein
MMEEDIASSRLSNQLISPGSTCRVLGGGGG